MSVTNRIFQLTRKGNNLMKNALPKFLLAAAVSITAAASNNLKAWGENGHSVTGIMALQLTNEKARGNLVRILGGIDDAGIGLLCNWPDVIREEAEWSWTAPQHFVNIPRSRQVYSRQRDCPNDLCVTEAIKTYAGRLADDRLSIESRAQSFAWLCHLVGDIHQPLHCGFADDRGGNNVIIEFAGESMDLHEFWDAALIRNRTQSVPLLRVLLQSHPTGSEGSQWSPESVNTWTNESHELAAVSAYPDAIDISEPFAENSWQLAQQQLLLAVERLALILDTVLGEDPVQPEARRRLKLVP